MFATISLVNSILDAVNQLGSMMHAMSGAFGGIL